MDSSPLTDSMTDSPGGQKHSADLRAIADTIPTLIIQFDLEFRYVFVNRAYEEWTGRALEAIRGRSLREVIDTDIYPSIFEAMSRAAHGEQLSFEHLAGRADGQREHMLFTFVPMKNDIGVIAGVLVTGQTIEQQKVAERSSQERRNELSNLFEQAPAPLALMMGPEHLYTLANKPYIELTGRNPLGQPARFAFSEEPAQGMLTILDDVYRTGVPFYGSGVDFARVDKTGARVEMKIDINFYPYRSGTGEINGVITSISDVTEQIRARDSRLASESMLRSIFAHASVGFAVSDLRGQFLNSNPRFEEITGYSADELSRLRVSDILHPDDVEKELALLKDLEIGKNESVIIEKRFVQKNGEIVWVRNSVSLLPGPRPIVIRVAEDVTEIRDARRKSSESEDRFRKLANSMPQIVWSATPDGFIDYFNDVWFEYIGRVETDFTESWNRAAHPDDLQGAIRIWAASLKAKKPFEYKVRLRSKTGEYRWFMARATPSLGADGEVVKWFGTNVDIHEFQVLTQELLETERNLINEQLKFRSLINESTTPMAVLRGDQLEYEIVNKSYQNLFEGRVLVGKPVLEALPELNGQAFPRLLRSALAGERYEEREALARLRRTDSSDVEDRYFDQSYSQIRDQAGKPYGVFVQAIDVSERVHTKRRLEELAERAEFANNAKSAFLANMSHEIRTPLGAIMGFVSLIKDEGASAHTVSNYLSVIERNSTQLMRIIDDILDLSKVEAGMMVIEHIDFSLVELLSDFASLMGFRSRDKGIIFELKAKTELPDIVNSDPTRLRQILTNVVGNAIKFTDQGSVALSVSYEDNRLHFDVQDTGRGVTSEQAKMLFQPFAQGDPSTTRKYGGTGLGLVLTRRLTEAMGGEFTLKESEPGIGSRFVASIEVSRPAHSQLVRALGFASEPIRNAGVQGRLRGVRVLLVEDSPDNQALFSIYLNRAGAKIDIASDGRRGVEMALADTYDVVLMDVQMPIMDGISAVRELRSQGYQTPIVALTAHAMKEEKIRCLEAGYTSFLSKPVQRGELVEALAVIVNEKSHHSAAGDRNP